jgi:hypothetical protein
MTCASVRAVKPRVCVPEVLGDLVAGAALVEEHRRAFVPVDELERLVAESRRPVRPRAPTEHDAGQSLSQIARGLSADRVPRAHGGARWWPSTVRSVLNRAETT